MTDQQIVALFGDRGNRDPAAPVVLGVEITGKRGQAVDAGEAVSDVMRFLVPQAVAEDSLFLRVAEY